MFFKEQNQQTLHFANQGTVTWADFAKFILKTAGYPQAEVVPITSVQLNRPAARPENSVLCLNKAQKLGLTFRSWQEAFCDFLREFRQTSHAVPKSL